MAGDSLKNSLATTAKSAAEKVEGAVKAAQETLGEAAGVAAQTAQEVAQHTAGHSNLTGIAERLLGGLEGAQPSTLEKDTSQFRPPPKPGDQLALF